VDSIQTVFLPGLESAPGSVSQVRECAARLMLLAKGRGMAAFLVGHVTKDGAIAGPRVLEHLVDTVLYFEGEQHHAYRILRAVKNRFGSTNEIGVFEMVSSGSRGVETRPASSSPSARAAPRAPSSSRASRAPDRSSSRCRPSSPPPASERRAARCWGRLQSRLSAPGRAGEAAGIPAPEPGRVRQRGRGARVTEPASDLGIAIAAASSYLDRPVRGDVVIMGEVGLTGEVRAVAGFTARLKEAAALGFTAAVVPQNNSRQQESGGGSHASP